MVSLCISNQGCSTKWPGWSAKVTNTSMYWPTWERRGEVRRWGEGRVPSGQTSRRMKPTPTWGSSTGGGSGRVSVWGATVTFRHEDMSAPQRGSFLTLTVGFEAGQWSPNVSTNVLTQIIWHLSFTVLTFILTRAHADKCFVLCSGLAPWFWLGQPTVDTLVQLQTFSTDEEVHVDHKVLFLLLQFQDLKWWPGIIVQKLKYL